MDIVESNKIIAEFIGFKFSEHFGAFMTESGNVQFYKAKYHKSWSRLMPVIEKIESLGYWTEIIGSAANASFQIGRINENHFFIQCTSNSKIEAAYTAVVDFIKNYKY